MFKMYSSFTPKILFMPLYVRLDFAQQSCYKLSDKSETFKNTWKITSERVCIFS